MKVKKCLDCDTQIVGYTKSGRCSKCYMKVYAREYYQKNKETIVEKHKVYRTRFTTEEWKAKNREKMKAYRLRKKDDIPYYTLKHKYGIDKAEFFKLLNEQGGKCGICKSQLGIKSSRNIHVDHDHTTSIVRGLLCHQCNVGLGHFRGNRLNLIAAIRYLERQVPTCHPARRVAGSGLCNTCYRAKLRYVKRV